MNDYILENISVQMKCESSDDDDISLLVPLFCLSIDKLAFNETNSIYAVYERREKCSPTGKFNICMKFNVRDCDPDSGIVDESSYPDEYVPNSVDIYIGDYMTAHYSDFEQVWNESKHTSQEAYQLSNIKSVAALVEYFNLVFMSPINFVVKEQPRSQMNFVGMYNDCVFAVKILCVLHPTEGVTMQVTAKCSDQDIAYRIANAVQ
jgi:coatomer protein complex subunit gamma